MAIVGCPHFKGTYKQLKQANYTIYKVLHEFIDNIIDKAPEIHIKLKLNDDKSLKDIIISDNYESGFENINCDSIENPFNMSHTRIGHGDDNETSQFGIGMKGAAIASCEKMIVYTKVETIYYRVELDFDEMCSRENPVDSYNPDIFSPITNGING